MMTLNSRLRYVRNLFNFAHEQGYCDKLKIKLIKENVENKTPLTKHEVQKLITRPKNRRFTEVKMWVIANLVLSTGIRSRNVMNSYQYLVKVLYLNIYGDEGYESSDTILQNKVSIYEKFGYANQ